MQVLADYLNARDSANFRRSTPNIKLLLPKGSIVKIQMIKTFTSGNLGFQVAVLNGPHTGETAWVYYDRQSPAMTLYKEDPAPKSQPLAKPPKEVEPKDAKYAVTNRDVTAIQKKPAAPAILPKKTDPADPGVDLAQAIDCYDAMRKSVGIKPGDGYPDGYLAVRFLVKGRPEALLFSKRTALIFSDGISRQIGDDETVPEFFGNSPKEFQIPETQGKDYLNPGTRAILRKFLEESVQVYAQEALSAPSAAKEDSKVIFDPKLSVEALKTCARVKAGPSAKGEKSISVLAQEGLAKGNQPPQDSEKDPDAASQAK